jgi:hypothetical protein
LFYLSMHTFIEPPQFCFLSTLLSHSSHHVPQVLHTHFMTD